MNDYEENTIFADNRIIYLESIEYLIRNIFHPVLLSINDQLLLHKKTQNYSTTKSNFIQPFFVFKNEIRIFIKSIDEEVYSFVVKNDDYIRNIKMEICDKFGLIEEEQILCYQGEILDDMMTLNDYNIINNSMINIFCKLRGGMQIFARTLDGKSVTFEVLGSDKIIDVKCKIQEKLGMHPDEQRLVFAGGALEDDKTLDDYQVNDKSVINVVTRLRGGMQLFAKTMDGKTVAFEVQKSEKIIDIKKKIQEKIGLHPDEQKLVFQGAILEDEKTIDESQIAEKSVINVVARLRGGMQLFAKTMDGKTVTFEVERSEKLLDLKKKIQEKLGLHADEQKLIYQGVILEGDNKTVESCQITDKSVINIVATLRGGLLESLKSGEEQLNLCDLEKLDETIGLDRDEQILICQYKLLLDDDSKTVDEYERMRTTWSSNIGTNIESNNRTY